MLCVCVCDSTDREGLMVQAEEAVKMGYSGKQVSL